MPSERARGVIEIPNSQIMATINHQHERITFINTRPDLLSNDVISYESSPISSNFTETTIDNISDYLNSNFIPHGPECSFADVGDFQLVRRITLNFSQESCRIITINSAGYVCDYVAGLTAGCVYATINIRWYLMQ